MKPASGPTIIVHALWILTEDAPPLTEAVVSRLAPYLTRWAKTMGVPVWAVGGAAKSLHLLFDLPFDRTVQTVSDELQDAVTRYARETLGVEHLEWEAAPFFVGVSGHEKAALSEYIRDSARHYADGTIKEEWEVGVFNGYDKPNGEENEPVPEWLRPVLSRGPAPIVLERKSFRQNR